MKKVFITLLLVIVILGFVGNINSFAQSASAISEEAKSNLIEIKEKSDKSLEKYKEEYGSDTYGMVAYILSVIRIYSFPACFLGIAVSAIYQYVIGIRKLDNQEKGLFLMVSFITILVVCQVLPLAFAIVVKFGRG